MYIHMCRIFEALIAYGFAHILKKDTVYKSISVVYATIFSFIFIGPFYLSIYFCDLLSGILFYILLYLWNLYQARICYHCIFCLYLSLFSVFKYSLLFKIVHLLALNSLNISFELKFNFITIFFVTKLDKKVN